MQETESGVYEEGTRLNVLDSDGTMILYSGEFTGARHYLHNLPTGITNLTSILDLGNFPEPREVINWIRSHLIDILNVASPRGKQHREIHSQSLGFVRRALTQYTRWWPGISHLSLRPLPLAIQYAVNHALPSALPLPTVAYSAVWGLLLSITEEPFEEINQGLGFCNLRIGQIPVNQQIGESCNWVGVFTRRIDDRGFQIGSRGSRRIAFGLLHALHCGQYHVPIPVYQTGLFQPCILSILQHQIADLIRRGIRGLLGSETR